MIISCKRLAENIIKQLNEYGGFDGWWDDIAPSDKKEIVQDIADMLKKTIEEQ